jgi:hypothetical protein
MPGVPLYLIATRNPDIRCNSPLTKRPRLSLRAISARTKPDPGPAHMPRPSFSSRGFPPAMRARAVYPARRGAPALSQPDGTLFLENGAGPDALSSPLCHFRTLPMLAEPITPVPRRPRPAPTFTAMRERCMDERYFPLDSRGHICPTCPQSRGRLPRHPSCLSESTRLCQCAAHAIGHEIAPYRANPTLRCSESVMSYCGARRGNRVHALP